jgi:hypothetical protein
VVEKKAGHNITHHGPCRLEARERSHFVVCSKQRVADFRLRRCAHSHYDVPDLARIQKLSGLRLGVLQPCSQKPRADAGKGV